MSDDYYESDGEDVPIYYCRECGDPTEGDPDLCWGCDPKLAKQSATEES